MDDGTRSERDEDADSGKAGEPEPSHVNDLPTKTRREAEDEMLETPAAP
jgi:hypothetical protein